MEGWRMCEWGARIVLFLIWIFSALVSLTITIAIIYVTYHFIVKYW